MAWGQGHRLLHELAGELHDLRGGVDLAIVGGQDVEAVDDGNLTPTVARIS